ncbi:hypothetical protein JGC56_17585 [Salmonella enterica subsp. enterica serovar Saintpaul]|nr:hypothetical protein [Salmonella enterica subsp. enterica serovar Saintpaul]
MIKTRRAKRTFSPEFKLEDSEQVVKCQPDERQRAGQDAALECLRNALRVLPGYPAGDDSLMVAITSTGYMDGLPAGFGPDIRIPTCLDAVRRTREHCIPEKTRPGRQPVKWRFWRPFRCSVRMMC